MTANVTDEAEQPEQEARPRTGLLHSRRTRIALVALAVAAVVGVAAWVIFGIGIESLINKIQKLPAALVLTLVFLLPALEASAFVGVVFPGEIAVLVGGVSAADHHVSIAAVLVSASLGAVIGDQIGYFVGRRWGMQLLRKLPDRLLDEEKLEAARAYVRRLGAKAVVLGRWTAALRALVPGLAGVSQMPYARFLVANVIGGVLWACTCGIVGYVAGDNWHSVQHTIGSASYVLLGVIVVGLLGWHFWRRRQEKRKAAEAHDA